LRDFSNLPSAKDLQEAYERLLGQRQPLVSEVELVQLAQWARLDARLAEILVEWIGRNFQTLNPWKLRLLNRQQVYPSVLCAVLDVCQLVINKSDKRDFSLWKSLIQQGISPAPFQSFYVAQRSVNPERNWIEIKNNLKPFKKWGFFSAELPISGKRNLRKTLMTKKQRLQLLKDWLRSWPREWPRDRAFSVSDYLEKLNYQVSLRQAQRDLESCAYIKAFGQTRGRFYRRKN
jgi:hypothetical protein